MKTIEKKEYKKPNIENVIIDSEISLILQSNNEPAWGPGES